MRKLSLILAITFLLPTCFSLIACEGSSSGKELVLNVYNWEEYIADDVIEGFEKEYARTHNGTKVKVNYSTFGTCENMYNELKLTQNKNNGNFKYDLVCPSDYMIQRMIEEDMCEKIEWKDDQQNYENNTSQYIKDLFDRELQPANTSLSPYKLSDYSACYMWGTMGFVYNPEFVNPEDMNTWKGVLNPKYKNRITIKDSVRDSYILAMGIAYEEELMALKTAYPDPEEYNKQINDFFNLVTTDKNGVPGTITKTAEVLKKVKSNLYGFEVDSGKNDMATGKLWINFAWSGDAVYILDVAEDEEGTELYYSVPQEGSNIFFDGWVMPKGANKELAQEFLDYMFRTEIAVENMNYIGYTASTAGLDIFENAIDWYGLTTLIQIEETDYKKVIADRDTIKTLKKQGESISQDLQDNADRVVAKLNNVYYEEVYVYDSNINLPTTTQEFNLDVSYFVYDEKKPSLVVGIETENVTVYPRDLSYFFGNDQEIIDSYGATIIYTDTLGRQFTTQYPDKEILDRCAIMKHLPSSQLEELNEMWSSTKIGKMEPIYMVGIVVLIALLIAMAIIFFKLVESGKFGYGKARKNLTLVNREEIKN